MSATTTQADQPPKAPAPRPRPGVAAEHAQPPAGGTIKRWRLQMKRQVSSMNWEISMLVIVVAYMAVVLATFLLADQKVNAHS